MSESIPPQVEEFIAWLATERGLSTNYQLGVQSALERFCKWSEYQNAAALEQTTPARLTDYLAWRKRAGLETSSIRFEAVALRIFFRFLSGRDRWPLNPAEHLSLPRAGLKLPGTLSVPQMQALIESVQGDSPLALRDRALLELLYAGGLRVTEVCDLRLENVELAEGWIRVTGKGEKTRLVPLGSPALKALDVYLSRARPELVRAKTGGEVFLSVRGRRLTPQRIWQLTKSYAALAGVEDRVFPHQFRHSFATHLLAGGADLRIIQELLGHSDISTTQVYTHVEKSGLKSVLKRFHPRA